MTNQKQNPKALFKVDRPLKCQKPWRAKCYVGQVYFVWQHRMIQLRREFRTATEAMGYSERFVNRYIRMYTPEESSQ